MFNSGTLVCSFVTLSLTLHIFYPKKRSFPLKYIKVPYSHLIQPYKKGSKINERLGTD